MRRIQNVRIIRRFVNNGDIYGVYIADLCGNDIRKDQIFVQNGDDVGIVSFFANKPVTKCIRKVCDDVKEELLREVDKVTRFIM